MRARLYIYEVWWDTDVNTKTRKEEMDRSRCRRKLYLKATESSWHQSLLRIVENLNLWRLQLSTFN